MRPSRLGLLAACTQAGLAVNTSSSRFVLLPVSSYPYTRIHLSQLETKAISDVSPLINQFCREYLLSRQLQHPNLVPLLGICPDFAKVGRQLVPGSITKRALGSVKDALYDCKDISKTTTGYTRSTRFLANGPILLLLLDVASGLAYLHKRKLVHADLAARNVLLCPRDNVILDASVEVRLFVFLSGFCRMFDFPQEEDQQPMTQEDVASGKGFPKLGVFGTHFLRIHTCVCTCQPNTRMIQCCAASCAISG
jgi:serine/threonine protein kinase